MTNNARLLGKKTLALAVAAVVWAPAAFGQDGSRPEPGADGGPVVLEEILVRGVRESQAKSIDIKRDSAAIVDSIVADDIGKLPDTTITDSLQRIPGVQIKREANEGTALNVRGMPQVLTTLNGEQFLSPWNITEAGANYGDIPAGMITGVDVYKSMSASMLAGGISGLVDLKTLRPLSLDEGWMGNARVELSQGSRSKEEMQADGTTGNRDPDNNLSVIVGHNYHGRLGFTLGGFAQSSYAANYQVYDEQRLAFLDSPNGSPYDPLDLNGDGDTVNDWYLVPQEYGARSNFMEREREGLSLGLEAQLNDSVTVRGDVFYTHMEQFDRGVKAAFEGKSSVNAYENNGQPATDDTNLYNVLQPGSVVREAGNITYVDGNGVTQTRTLHTLQVARIESPAFQSTSTSESNRTAALNTNFQLDYTNHDNFDATLRYVHSEAEKLYRKAKLQQGTPAWLWVDADGQPGKDPLTAYNVTVDYRGEIPSFHVEADLSNPDLLESYQADAEGANTQATLNVFRADATFTFDSQPLLESLNFGTRYGVREAEHDKFYYVAPTARYSNWDDPRVAEDRRFHLRAGDAVWQKYPEWRRFDFASEDQRLVDIGGLQDNGFGRDDTMAFTDFGPIRGFEGGVSALNPAAWDDPLAFMNSLYPGTRTAYDPSYRYSVEEAATSAYAQLNFNSDNGVLGIPYSGNLGLNMVRTERSVERTVVPEVLDRFNSIGYDDWQKIPFVYSTETIEHSLTNILPSLNINLFPTEDTVVRLGAAKAMTNNNLHDVGSGLFLWYQQCAKTDENGDRVYVEDPNGNQVGETVSCVGGGNDNGDPYIEPWESAVYNTSVEWYFDENAILAGGLFLIDNKRTVEGYQEQRSFLDGDGIDRGRTANIWVTDTVGASNLYGFEMGYKQPFRFLPGEYLSALGMEFNYTYSQSESNDADIFGEAFPLPSNSKQQSNLILWYDKDGVNVRLAYNWRSKEYLGRLGLNSNTVPLNIGNWLQPTGYLDLSVNYWVNEHFSFYINGTNLTDQHRVSYSQFEDQFNSIWVQERRYSAGFTLSL